MGDKIVDAWGAMAPGGAIDRRIPGSARRQRNSALARDAVSESIDAVAPTLSGMARESGLVAIERADRLLYTVGLPTVTDRVEAMPGGDWYRERVRPLLRQRQQARRRAGGQ